MYTALFIISLILQSKQIVDPTFEPFNTDLATNSLTQISASVFPDTYDPRGVDPCLPSIMNQGSCGNCYAFAVSYAYSFRYCKKTQKSIQLSVQDLTMCDVTNQYCNGGSMDSTISYLENYGAIPSSCVTFNSNNLGTCTYGKCNNGSMTLNKYFCQPGTSQFINNTTLNGQSILTTTIKNEIFNRGAVSATITSSSGTFQTYYTSYNNNIFSEEANPTSLSTDHAIAIIGWGPGYWIIANSWGPYWGYKGFAKISMGIRKLGASSYFCTP